MNSSLTLPFTQVVSSLGDAGFSPVLPLTLISGTIEIEKIGLLDTGAAVNVLPFKDGLSLGLSWEKQVIPLQLTGNLANYEARAVLLSAKVGNFDPVRLAFAWTIAENVPLLLGLTNFFMEFDVCFFRSKLMFEVKPK